MEIKNDSPSIVLPEAVRKAIESGRDSVTLLQQEADRLKGVIKQEEYQIKAHLGTIASHEERIKQLEEKKSELESLVNEKRTSHVQLLADYKKTQDALQSANSDLIEARKEVKAHEEKMKKDREALKEDRKNHEALKNALNEERAAFNAKVAKVNKALGSL